MTALNSRIAILSLVFLVVGFFFAPILNGQNALHLNCEKKEIDDFCRSVQSYPKFTQVELVGPAEDINWKRLSKALNELPALEDLRLINNALEDFPEGITALKNLRCLTVVGSDELEMESCLEVFAGLPQLKKITWELYELDAVPFDIILLEQVDTIVIIDGELADVRKFYPDVLSDSDLEHRFSKMAVPATSADATPIEVEFITMFDQIPNAILAEEIITLAMEEPVLMYACAKRIEPPTKPWTRNYTNVSTPFKDVQIEKEFYEVDVELPTVVCTERSGTQVIIPPHSFVDVNGSAIEGKVIVDYREFLDVADQILSGIPMSFIDNEEVSLFRSAGMFEINASQDGKEVFLKEDSQLTINFSSVDSLDRFQFYVFNDSTNSWVDLGNANLGSVAVNLEEFRYSAAATYYNRWSGQGYSLLRPDSILFAERYNSLCYSGTKRDWKSYDDNMYDGYGRYISSEIRLIKIRKCKGRVIFSLEGASHNNPEMKKIHVNNWRVTSKPPIKAFRKEFNHKRFFCDIRMMEDDGNYLLQLKDDTSFSTIQVAPMAAYRKNGRTYYKDQSLSLDAYNKALQHREKQFDKGLKRYNRRVIQKSLNKSKSWKDDLWRNTREFMTIAERQMNQEQWMVYCDSIKKQVSQDFSKVKLDRNSFTRSLSIDGFGIFNCDQIERLVNPVVIAATYEDQNGKRVHNEIAYVVDKNINGVLTYDGYRQMGPTKFALDPESVQSIIVVDKDGKMGLVDLDDLKAQNPKDRGRYTLKIETFETPLSVTEFRSRIGI
jgi:hypothetical protein